MSQRPVKAVIFDLDGLLLDTEPIYQSALQSVCRTFEKDYDEATRRGVVGCGEVAGAQHIVTRLSLPISAEELLTRRDVFLEQMFPHAKPMPGAELLSKHLRKHNIPLAIGTSSLTRFVHMKTKPHQAWFDNTFHAIVAGDHPQVKHGKPHPDIYLAAAAALKIAPEECLVFDDAPSGCTAGKAARMQVVAVPSLEPELYSHADLVLKSLLDFDPALYGLPKLV